MLTSSLSQFKVCSFVFLSPVGGDEEAPTSNKQDEDLEGQGDQTWGACAPHPARWETDDWNNWLGRSRHILLANNTEQLLPLSTSVSLICLQIPVPRFNSLLFCPGPSGHKGPQKITNWGLASFADTELEQRKKMWQERKNQGNQAQWTLMMLGRSDAVSEDWKDLVTW